MTRRIRTALAAASSALRAAMRPEFWRTRPKAALAAAASALRAAMRPEVWRTRPKNALAAAASALRAAMRPEVWRARARAALAAAASALRAASRPEAWRARANIVLAAAGCALLLIGLSLVLWVTAPVATGEEPPAEGEVVLFTVAPGATFEQITDTLVVRGLVRRPLAFRIYGRLRRDDRSVRSGAYSLAAGDGWKTVLDALVEGRVRMVPVTIPEGFTLPQIATRIAPITQLAGDTVEARLGVDSAHVRWSLPGPGLEGYLFPDTYLFADGVPLETVLEAMSTRYRSFWTPARRARAGELELSEREVVTLASIIQAEVRVPEEMRTISAVYHNRLRIGMPLQADPTVLYALGGHRPRLLFAAMDSVVNHPYNTYAHGGLPPGPIGAPGAAALDAALHPAESDYLYFVANPDGSHTFTRTLAEHNRATVRARRAASASPGGG